MSKYEEILSKIIFNTIVNYFKKYHIILYYNFTNTIDL
jgi:hypothetical protein